MCVNGLADSLDALEMIERVRVCWCMLATAASSKILQHETRKEVANVQEGWEGAEKVQESRSS
jgi:hypothetical protein